MRESYIYSSLVILIFFMVLYSHTFSRDKKIEPAEIEFVNLGYAINSVSDEYMPVIENDKLIFRRSALNSLSSSSGGKFYSVSFQGTEFSNNTSVFNLAKFTNNQPATVNESDEQIKIQQNNILFQSSLSLFNYDKNWKRWQSEIKKIDDLNSDSADFHPAVSRNGEFIVFASTRKNANSSGGSDLYLVRRLDVGKQSWKEFWTEPQNLNISSAAGIKINTDNNELAPFIDETDTLWFVSNGFRKDAGQVFLTSNNPSADDPADIYVLESELNYDVIKASPVYDAEGNVTGYDNPEKLPAPFNTEYDEAGVARSSSNLVIASNRPGGFGGYDLYAFASNDNCRDVNLNITHNSVTNCSGFSRILVHDAGGSLIKEAIMEGKTLKLSVPYHKEYKVILKNSCYPDGQETRVFAECSPASTPSYSLSFKSSCNCPKVFMPFVLKGYLKCCGNDPFISDIEIFNDQNLLLKKTKSGPNGYFEVILDQEEHYFIRVKSDCLKKGFLDFEKWHTGSKNLIDTVDLNLVVPSYCCPTSNVHVIDSRNMFFAGYYIPNTYANVHDYIQNEKNIKSRLKQYKSADYIAPPSSLFNIEKRGEFKRRTLEVEKKIAAATVFILDKIDLLQGDCCSKIKIFINGYPDPKALPVNALYVDTPVYGDKLYLNTGDKIDNNTLALLRAHHTANMLKENLSYDPVYAAHEDQVEWIIQGMENIEKGKDKQHKKIDIIITCDGNE